MTANAQRFDAVLFDAGGVLVLPDPTVLVPLLDFYGGDTSIEAHRRAHYAGMRDKSHEGSPEDEWLVYDVAYVAAVGVRRADRNEAADVLNRTRTPDLWRWPIPETLVALRRLAELACQWVWCRMRVAKWKGPSTGRSARSAMAHSCRCAASSTATWSGSRNPTRPSSTTRCRLSLTSTEAALPTSATVWPWIFGRPPQQASTRS